MRSSTTTPPTASRSMTQEAGRTEGITRKLLGIGDTTCEAKVQMPGWRDAVAHYLRIIDFAIPHAMESRGEGPSVFDGTASRLWPAGVRGSLTGVLTVVGMLGWAGGSAGAAGGSGLGTGLPDGRAWEMVSPLDKNGGGISGIDGDNGGGVVEASPEGNGITYVSLASFGEPQGASIGSQYVSDRSAKEGWLAQNISVPMSAQTYTLGGAGTPYVAFSSSLSSGLVFNGRGGYQYGHPVESPPLAGAPAGYQNYYLREIPGDVSQALLTKKPSQSSKIFSLEFLGASSDLNHVAVSSEAVLAAGAIEEEGKSNLYEWERASRQTLGQFQPVNVLPSGAPKPSSSVFLGSGGGRAGHTISGDGSRVVWSDGHDLYLREDIGTPQAMTVQVDASQGGPDSGGGSTFLTANNEVSKIFFSNTGRLTSGATTGGEGLGNLYEFEPKNGPLGRLTDLTVDPTGADVQGVLGASEDGSYVYFVANGVLASGATPRQLQVRRLPRVRRAIYICGMKGNSRSSSRLSQVGTRAPLALVGWEWPLTGTAQWVCVPSGVARWYTPGLHVGTESDGLRQHYEYGRKRAVRRDQHSARRYSSSTPATNRL